MAQLEAIRAKYYIPRNTALFIGGDVKADVVFALAQNTSATGPAGPPP